MWRKAATRPGQGPSGTVSVAWHERGSSRITEPNRDSQPARTGWAGPEGALPGWASIGRAAMRRAPVLVMDADRDPLLLGARRMEQNEAHHDRCKSGKKREDHFRTPSRYIEGRASCRPMEDPRYF